MLPVLDFLETVGSIRMIEFWVLRYIWYVGFVFAPLNSERCWLKLFSSTSLLIRDGMTDSPFVNEPQSCSKPMMQDSRSRRASSVITRCFFSAFVRLVFEKVFSSQCYNRNNVYLATTATIMY